MDFIESAMVMVPALTGMDLIIYDGKSETLAQLEDKCCFSPELQPIYTQKGLTTFLEDASEAFIYDIADVLETRFIAVKSKGRWMLFGPYVEEGWSEHSARLLLVEAGASESTLLRYKAYRCKFPMVQRDYALNTALLVVQHLGNETRVVKTLRLTKNGRDDPLTFSDVYANASEINRRYLIEDLLINAIARGDASKALQARRDRSKVNLDFQYFKDSRQALVGATIERTVIRVAARLGGLNPVIIDTIVQEYAQKMCFTTSQNELDCLIIALIEHFCSEIQKQRQSGYSPIVQQAIDYMEVNLSKPMTTAEIARAVGVERKSFTCRFHKETKMTVKEYLANRRCAIAAQLFLDSKASIQDVATYVGYPDSNYFAKVFKANMGVSPQEYRSIRKFPIENSLI